MGDDRSVASVLGERMARQGLVPPGTGGVVAAARGCAGIQAQDLLASQLAVRCRSHGLRRADVVAACDRGTVVRTWLMRATLHLVDAHDTRWLVGLLGPGLIAKYRRRRHELGLDDTLCEQALAALPDVLAGRALTRAGLVAALADQGITIPVPGQAPAHLLMLAAASGLICRAADDGREPTYRLLEEWLPAQSSRPSRPPAEPARPAAPATPTAPAAELARRYFAAFAPASVADFVAWSGLPAGTARAGLSAVGEQLRPVSCAGQSLLAPDDALAAPAGDTWRLLGGFDTFLMGYRNRDLGLDPAHAPRLNAGGGWVHPAVVRGGRLVGRWRLHPDGRLAVELFGARRREARQALSAEADDVGRFLDRTVHLELRD